MSGAGGLRSQHGRVAQRAAERTRRAGRSRRDEVEVVEVIGFEPIESAEAEDFEVVGVEDESE